MLLIVSYYIFYPVLMHLVDDSSADMVGADVVGADVVDADAAGADAVGADAVARKWPIWPPSSSRES